MSVEKLWDLLPDIIFYLVVGYIFIKSYCFVSGQKNEKTTQEHIYSSLVVGFVIVKIMNCIPWNISPEVDSVGIVVTSAIIGFVLGKVINSQKIIRVYDTLQIGATINKYIWNDLMDPEFAFYVRVKMKDGMVYSGYSYYIEEYNNVPTIVLAGYVIEKEEKCIVNNKEDIREIIFLNLADAQNVVIRYDAESSKCEEIKELIDNYNREDTT